MYTFKEKLNCGNFFRFDKMIIRKKIWAKLPTASKTIYPVIGVHCNAEGVAFPSELTIAKLSGCTEKTVREGIKGLMGLRGFHKERYITYRGQRAIKYRLNPLPVEKGRAFFFHKVIIEGGNWSQLTPTARALYPVLRLFSFHDYYEYLIREDLDPSYNDNMDLYKERKYDFLIADIDVIAEHAGISIRSIPPAMKALQENYLLEETEPIYRDDNSTWKVYLIPTNYFERDWLNQEAFKKHRTVELKKLPTK